jgi:predicted RNase H-like HicB family nuclease
MSEMSDPRRGSGRLPHVSVNEFVIAGSTVSCMAAHSFSVVFEDAGDGWVYAHVPELPEVQTQGESLKQARELVRDAIALVLEEREARGEEIPSKGWALVESVEIAA